MKLVETKADKPTLVIEFSPDDCEVLSVVLCRIGGSPESGRGVCSNLANIFHNNGYDFTRSNYYPKIEGNLYFQE